MVLDLVVIRNCMDLMGSNMTFVVECLRSTGNPYVLISGKLRRGRILIISINPLLHLNNSCAIVHPVGDVRSLLADITDLGNESDLNWLD